MNDQIIARKEKLTKLKNEEIVPYPHTTDITNTIPEILKTFSRHYSGKSSICTAGRITRLAKKGKLTFADLSDSQSKIQLVFSKKELEKQYSHINMLNTGDFLEVTGTAYLTNTGQKSLYVQSFKILCKSLRPLPAPKQKANDDGSVQIFDGFSDTELRYRRRPVDLLLNAESMERFIRRSKIISSIRNYLDSRGYIEVQTPVLQNNYGGASARPFTTEYKALDMEVYLRISNELYLKQCIVGGINRVYEIGKDFRNEGIDRTHSPEFTMIEFYEAYADYKKMMVHFEQIFCKAAESIFGTAVITYNGLEIDLSPPWKRITFYDAIKDYTGIDPEKIGLEELGRYCIENQIELPANPSRGEIFIAVFEEKVESQLIQPHIVYDYPKESTPLCKAHRSNPDLVEQFEPYINGWEMGNAYTELNDPELQRSLLTTQSAKGRGKEDEEYPADESFLEALEYGMPPTGGAGIGIDRMVMLLTNSTNIRDVILFPLMKPEKPK